MARAVIYNVQNAPVQGIQLTWTPVTASTDSFIAAAGRVLLIWNASGVSTTVTIPSVKTIDNLVLADRTITVPAGTIYAFDPGGQPGEGVQTDGSIWINYSATATVSAAYLQI